MDEDRTPRRRARLLAGGAVLCLALGGCAAPAPAGSPGPARSTPAASDVAPEPRGSTAPVPPAASGPAPGAPTSPAPVTTPPATAAAAPGATAAALAVLDRLPVRGRAPRTGYDRDLFGQAWADTDRNGCDTRNDVLRRDLAPAVLEGGTNGCLVLSGVLHDPFSGASIAFERGPSTSSEVQIDHVVALSDAWQKGAQQWTPQRRVAFANDPLNLLAVDGALNGQKSDGDAATWLPPNRAFRCAYVARQVGVKATFGLWVTSAERDAIARVLAACPGERAPTSTLPTESDVGAAAPPPATPPPPATAPPAPVPFAAAPPAACDPAYPSVCIAPASGGDLDCGDVPATGFAVLPPDPHGLDRDGDGVGCDG